MIPAHQLRNITNDMYSNPKNDDFPLKRNYLYKEIQRCLIQNPNIQQEILESIKGFSLQELSLAINFFINFEPLSKMHRRTKAHEYFASLPCYKEFLIFWFEKHFEIMDLDTFCAVFRIRCCNPQTNHSQLCIQKKEAFLQDLGSCFESD
ncbi:hypothetical protein SteCoe_5722 [Stentor coeruleus]|uniref:Uncharacterized protein n=1 Tax=Stentor coeruleus TaxID=5963 RepID=A0A1R2CRT9_9CILI|nr:hypothetical protein SteCoe_5722 [Stentor coeruleus]